VIATAEPQKKLCDGYETLFWLNEIEEESGKIVLEIAQEKSKSKKRK